MLNIMLTMLNMMLITSNMYKVDYEVYVVDWVMFTCSCEMLAILHKTRVIGRDEVTRRVSRDINYNFEEHISHAEEKMQQYQPVWYIITPMDNK